VLIRKMELDQVLARLEEPGHVIRTSLSKEIESQLNEVFGQTGK
jgi:uncharacterized membrane protein